MIYVTMFGRFELHKENEEKPIRFSSKANCLLAYLITHRNEICNRERIMEELWGGNNTKNPVNALKTSISRLRSSLDDIFGSNDYILQIGNGYQWNTEIPVCVDTEQMDAYYSKANCVTSVEQKIADYKKAMELYRGQFMIEAFEYQWVTASSHYYQALYFNIILKLIDIFNQEKNYTELEEICRKALEIENLNENIYYYYILSKIKLKKYDEALEVYNRAELLLQKELGITHPEKLSSLWEYIFMKTDRENDITFSLIEGNMDYETATGAYFCGYSLFKEIVQLEARRLKRELRSRNKRIVLRYLAILTVESIKDQERLDHRENLEYFQAIEDSIQACLRAGDIITHCSYHQYVILLYGGSQDDCNKTLCRVKSYVTKCTPSALITISYKELLGSTIFQI